MFRVQILSPLSIKLSWEREGEEEEEGGGGGGGGGGFMYKIKFKLN